MENFRDYFKENILLADGAIGTYLVEKGVDESENKSLQSVLRPELVKKIHLEYLNAGADIITTNTFDANHLKLKSKKFSVEEVLSGSVSLAKKALTDFGEKKYIAGSVGPLGILLRPYGILTFQEMSDIYSDITSVLISSGVDIIVFETFSSLLELKAAVNAVRKFSDIPIISSMTFNTDGVSILGDEIEKSLIEIHSNGADIVGMNCYLGPKDTYELTTDFLKKNSIPVSVMPNAGIPAIVNNRTIYLSNPEYFKEYSELYVKSGVKIIGSCCGTTPMHTQKMRKVIDELKPVYKKKYPLYSPDFKESDFKKKIGKEFVYNVEITPPKSLSYEKSISKIKKLKNIDIDAINVTENPLAKIRMSPSAFSKIILDKAEIEPVLHFTLRDRNLLAIQSDLLGAFALGIRNIFAIKGDPSIMGDFPRATTVYDVDTLELIRIVKNLNNGIDITGNKMKNKTDFLIGAAANPGSKDPEGEVRRVIQKIDAGADYIITQPVFDMEKFKNFKKLLDKTKIPVIAGLMEIKDLRYAMFLEHEVPGFSIPEDLINRFRSKESNDTGINVAVELGRKIKNISDGIYLVSSSGKINNIIKIIEDIKNG
ncbi:MAG: bifunctional homocysteine S-methyltransferase/methylenetetrahydrofolate reductase [Acidobacteriota bacterium]